jgi:hypothetical protein
MASAMMWCSVGVEVLPEDCRAGDWPERDAGVTINVGMRFTLNDVAPSPVARWLNTGKIGTTPVHLSTK